MNNLRIVLVTVFFLLVSCSTISGLFTGDNEPDTAQQPAQESRSSSRQDTIAATRNQPSHASRSASSATDREFYRLQQDLDSLKREMRAMRRYIRNTDSEISPFLLQKELQKVLSVPQITHEIELVNGTTVRGKIIRETVDDIVVQTQIGHLTLNRNLVKDTRRANPAKAKVVLNGPIEEETHEGKRVYRGNVKNTGLRRADFVRIVFELSNPSARTVATDSAFVDGATHMYNTSVLSDTSIEPGESASFLCPVFIPPEAKISYYTYEIHWSEE